MYASYNKNDLKELYQKHRVNKTKLFIANITSFIKTSVINSATIGKTSFNYITSYPEHVFTDDKIVAEIKNQLHDIFSDMKINVYNFTDEDEQKLKLVCEIDWE
jgi:hypothetical protein